MKRNILHFLQSIRWTRRRILKMLGCLILLFALVECYSIWFSRTKIAFVNFQPIALQGFSQANDNPMISLSDVSTKDMEELDAYDIVFINGMGLNITAEQRAYVKQLAESGKPIYTTMATNPDNNISNLTTEELALVKKYMMFGGKKNHRSLLSFIRHNIDGKIIFTGTALKPQIKPSDYLYYPSTDNNDEEQEFLTVKDYELFLRQHNLWHEGAQKVIVSGQITDPSDLILALAQTGKYNVYPVASTTKLQEFAEQIQPAAIINLAHGRLGDDMVEWLKRSNTLLFDPLTINDLRENWEADKLGMAGGFMSQSVVMPEIDGAIRTTALFAQRKDKNGLLQPYAMPDRLKTFLQTLDHYMALRTKRNADKRIAIVYFKGPGQASLVASGMDVVPSLYNMLCHLKAQGYNLQGLPATEAEFASQIKQRGMLFNSFAAGDAERFMKSGHPQLVSRKEYEAWCAQSLRKDKTAEVEKAFGAFPGDHNLLKTADGRLAFARLQYGNVVLLPQPMAGEGKDEFKMVHGTDQCPPHSYIAPYLWIQHGFQADALIHFGTHGSLEFTPRKQVALSDEDWPDRLVGALPHFYIYTIDNVGEAMMAKRRAYADLISYLTPPFHESGLRQTYAQLEQKIRNFENGNGDREKLRAEIKRLAVQLDLCKDLRLDTHLSKPLTDEEIEIIENYAEEITNEKVTGTPYTMGQAYADEDIHTSVLAMTTDPIAYCRYQLDRMKGRVGQLSKAAFSDRYLAQAKQTVERLYANPTTVTDATICSLAGISLAELQKSREVMEWKNAPKGMLAMMMAAKKHSKDSASAGKGGMADMMKQMAQSTDDVPPAKNNPIAKFMRHQMRKMLAKGDPSQMMEVARKMGASEEALKKMSAAMGKKANGGMGMMGNTSAPKYSRQEVTLAEAISQVETALKNVGTYRQLLHDSPTAEFAAISNALSGGYTPPSPGGDPIVNPNTLPTGRNLFAINAEETPSEDAWDKGVALAKATLADYQRTHKGAYPRKVSYTLWSGEFIQTGGATIAQVLYLLGVEPVRDRYGRVNDLKLIPSKELGRPRIDVVVQTSGQLRDLAASRLFLINRAVEMAASAADDAFGNMVKDGVEESERYLIDKGVPPAEARSMSKYRVFGGVQGGYGTGIQSMVEKGDAWDNDRQIAEQYIHNMGAFYGDQEHWEAYADDAFGAALTRTDVVMQPRQNNSWGALSLDHVYEFMGGMNLAVRKVTGKDPEAYFADYRNRNNYRVQDSKEAIAVEARTKLFNEQYVKESLKGGATSTDALAEMVRNTYGWNVMKPAAVNKDMWNEIYDVYVKDKFHLGIHEKMGAINPAAMQEITATMMETARKGYWKASPEQLREIAKVHTAFTRKYGASGSSFEGANSKLQDFIAKQSSASDAKAYKDNLRKQSHTLADSKQQAMVMKKQTTQSAEEMERTGFNGIYVVGIVLALFVAFAVIIRQKRKKL